MKKFKQSEGDLDGKKPRSLKHETPFPEGATCSVELSCGKEGVDFRAWLAADLEKLEIEFAEMVTPKSLSKSFQSEAR